MNNFKGIKMTTGYSADAANNHSDKFLNDSIAVIGVFIEDSMRLGACYCIHSGRTGVTSEDIGLALKTRAYWGDAFWSRPDIQERLNSHRNQVDEYVEELYSEDEEDEEDEENEENEENDQDYEPSEDSKMDESESEYLEEEWTRSLCTCEVCNTLNSIDEKWDAWNPNDRTGISLKNAINKALTQL